MRFVPLFALLMAGGLAASCVDLDERSPRLASEDNAQSMLQPDAGAAGTRTPKPHADDANDGESQTMPPALGGPCAAGASRCASATERSECTSDGVWSSAVACLYLCADGQCAGECAPDATECVSATRGRTCSASGAWSEPADCGNACVGDRCAGECKPGTTRCSSSSEAQTCSATGVWGAAAACTRVCVDGACTGECTPGSTRCSSETERQTCNDQGQWLESEVCSFACIDASCGGECVPGSRRCNQTGIPQVCAGTGTWATQAPCPFVCSGSGTCSGECVPSSRRCSPQSGVPQLCGDAGTWQSQAACPFACVDGACAGMCARGSQRACGECGDGSQTCANPITGEYSACVGASPRTRYFRDSDRDGFGDAAAPVDACGGPPSGSVANADDCCDRDARAFPGEPTYYPGVTACGGYDYDCSGSADLFSSAISLCDNFISTCFAYFTGWRSAAPNCGQSGNFVTVADPDPLEFCAPDIPGCLEAQASETAVSVQTCK